MRPFEMPISAGWKGCMPATFACPRSQALAARLVSSLHIWPQRTVRMCPPFCFSLGKEWLPSLCHPHSPPSIISFPDPGKGIYSLFGHTWINLNFYLSVSTSCLLFISGDGVSPAIYFHFLHEVQLGEAYECFWFIPAFSDLWDLALLTVSSFSIKDRFLLTLEHFLWVLIFAGCVKFPFLPFSPCTCNTQENS